MHTVVALALPDVVAFDLSIAAQIFGFRGEELYEFAVCSAAPGAVPTTTGFSLLVNHGLEQLQRADTVVVPGYEEETAAPSEPVLRELRAAAQRGARLVSICTGAFALAAAGLLDGRRATTHWRYAPVLAQLYPNVSVQPDVLYIDDGSVLTSAGVAAGIDLCLHIVARDHGAKVANAIARRIVIAPQRQGGQAQFVQRPVPDEIGGSLEPTRSWALERLAEPLTVRDLARHAGYSARSFARRFRAETGTTPLQWLIAQRTLKARLLLEAGDLPIEVIARRCGFGSSASFREHFRRATRTTPTAYRRAWSAVGAPDPHSGARVPALS